MLAGNSKQNPVLSGKRKTAGSFLFIAFLLTNNLIAQPNPGGVSGAAVWVRADDGVTTTDNSAKTTWNNQAGTNLTGTGTWRSNTANLVNFNPAIVFNGTSNYYQATGVLGTTAVTGFSSFIQARYTNETTTYGFVFGDGSNGTRISSHLPWVDGIIYWDFFNATNGRVTTTGTTIGQDIIYTYSKTAGSTQYIATRGNVLASSNTGALSFNPSTTPNNKFGLGGLYGGGNYYTGNMSEYIAYGTGLTATQITQVESYLAVKYGQTLAKNYLASDGTTTYAIAGYANNIAGIGRDDNTALNQKQSQSINTATSQVTVAAGTAAATNAANSSTIATDKQLLVWGDNNGSIATSVAMTGFTNANNRFTRIWRLQNTNAFSQQVTVYYPTAALSALGTGAKFLVYSDAVTGLSSGAGSKVEVAASGTTTINGVANTAFTFTPPATGTLYFSFSASPITLSCESNGVAEFRETFGSTDAQLPTAISTADGGWALSGCLNGAIQGSIADVSGDGDVGTHYLYNNTGGNCTYTAGQAVWKNVQTINLIGGQRYQFSYYGQLQNAIGIPVLSMQVVPVTGTIAMHTTSSNSLAVGSWVKNTMVFTPSANTAVTLRINNATTGGVGNDFYLDNIALIPLTDAGADAAVSCSSIPAGQVTLTATGNGTWSAAAGNPGTATIVSPTNATTVINNFSANGTYNFIWTSPGGCTDIAQVVVTSVGCPDCDGDGVPNAADLDDDNDGITDIIEQGCTSGNFTNGSFEQPVYPGSSAYVVDQNTVPGWRTTATDGLIEIWANGFNGVPAAQGAQFAELNATQVSTLYQTFCSNGASGTITWSLKHRGRSGTDVAALKFGGTVAAAQAAAATATLTDGNTAWGSYSGTINIPAGLSQFVIAFQSISAAGGNAAVGNFIDDVVITINQNQPDTDGDGIPNGCDLDSDGDGCSDANEYYNSRTADGGDGGTYGTGTPVVDIYGMVVGASYSGNYTNATTVSTRTICATSDFGDLLVSGGTHWPAASALVTTALTNNVPGTYNGTTVTTTSVYAGSAINMEDATMNGGNATASMDDYDDGLGSLVSSGYNTYDVPVSLNANQAGTTVYYRLWFDWNNDGNFANDLDGNGNPASYTGSAVVTTAGTPVIVPVSLRAPFGVVSNYKQRLVVSDAPIDDVYRTQNSTYVLQLTNGEVEDYNVPAAIILPLTLVSFDAASNGCTARLNWVTASEQNTSYFEIEQSTNGTTWTTASKVTAAGNSQNGKSYASFINLKEGVTNYLRLKMMDKDGHFTYSAVKTLRCNDSRSIVISPNPVKDQLFFSGLQGISELRIINNLGQVLKTVKVSSANYVMNVGDLLQGFYVAEIVQDGQKLATQKIIKE